MTGADSDPGNESTGRVDLSGAIDMHVHFGPDAYRNRALTAAGVVEKAVAAGHAGLVFKSHEGSTADLANALDESAPIAVLGGICCDVYVGGLNVFAVDAALRSGARIVWLPTISAAQDWQRYGRDVGVPHPGISVADGDKLVPEAQEIMALANEHGAILATGHVSVDEHLLLARCRPRDGRLLVTHALETLCGPAEEMTVDVLQEMVRLGAMVEFCALTCVGRPPSRPVGDIAAAILQLGAEHCTIASDLGQVGNPLHVDGLVEFAAGLVDAGVSPADVRRMATANPATLLGLQA